MGKGTIENYRYLIHNWNKNYDQINLSTKFCQIKISKNQQFINVYRFQWKIYAETGEELY